MSQFSSIIAQVVTTDLYTFALDSTNNILSKLEYTGEVVDTLQLDDTAGFNKDSLHVLSDGNLVVYDISGRELIYINPLNLSIYDTETIAVTSGDHLVLDINNNKIFGDWISVAVDNDNVIYTIENDPIESDYTTIGFSDGDAFDGSGSTFNQITSQGFNNVLYKYGDSAVTTIIYGTPQTINVGVSATNDDGHRNTNTYYSSSDTYLMVGKPQYGWSIFVRFSDIQIPAGSVITDSYITLRSDGVYVSPPDARVLFKAADDATAPVSYSTWPVAGADRTTATVSWDVPALSALQTVNTPDISTPLQEIIDRPGWVSGQAIVALIENAQTGPAGPVAAFHSFDSSGGIYAPRIYIEYIPPDVSLTTGSSGEFAVIDSLHNWARQPVIFTNNNYEEVQFEKLYPNSITTGILSKPFNPQSLFITKQNYLYVVNDTREIMSLEINENKPIRFDDKVVLFDASESSGSNIYDLIELDIGIDTTDLIQTPLWRTISATAISNVQLNATYEYDTHIHSDTLERDTSSDQFNTFFWLVDNSNKAMYKTDNVFTVVKCFSLPDIIDTLSYTGETYSRYSFTKAPATTYDWCRKFSWLANGQSDYTFTSSLYTLSSGTPVKYTLPVSGITLADDQWYHLALTYDISTGVANMYLDNVLVSQVSAAPNLPIYTLYETGGIVGSKLLRSNSINKELNCNMYSFNGAIYDVRMYALALSQSQLAQIILSNLNIEPISWNIPVGARQYIEQIEQFFMNRPPGSASQLYKIRLVGLNIEDQTVRDDIEQIIRDTVYKVAPAYTALYKIEWV